MTIFDLAVTMT